MLLKNLAHKYYNAVNNYDQKTIEEMVCEDYIQHNPYLATGRQAFVDFLPKLKTFETKIENIRMFQDGRYVIMHHRWHNALPFGADEMVAFHIIRFNGDQKIAEHWNVTMKDTPANNSKRSLTDGETQILDTSKTDSNRVKIVLLIKNLIAASSTDLSDILTEFFSADFYQHSSFCGDGVEQFMQFLNDRNFGFRYLLQHQIFAEGDFVVSISEALMHQQKIAVYDLFRMNDGLIEEHWSVIQDIPTGNVANTNTMFNFGN